MSKNIWLPKLNYYSKRLSMWQEKLWREVNGKPFMGILDNIAGRKMFEYATFGRSGVQQSNSKLFGMQPKPVVIPPQQMTMIHWQCLVGVGSVSGLTTQIDRGRYEYDDTGGTQNDPIYTFGYGASGEDWHNSTGYGSIDNDTYTDGGGTSRIVKCMTHNESALGNNDLIFSLDTTSVTNSNVTWLDITWDDTVGTPRTVTRTSDLTNYTASLNGSTHWRDANAPFNWSDEDLNTDFVLTTS